MPGREIINVTEADFEYEVLAYSKNTPVVVDFWAEWCQPCKVLTPLLEKLVGEMGGSFRLAKVDVDANPNLAARFNVRSIPTVIAFSDAAPREQLIGVQSEPRLRAFLEAIVPPSPLSLAIEKANGLLSEHNWAEAETEFRQILAKENDIPACLLGLSIAQLAQGKGAEGRLHLYNFPASKEFTRAETLIPYADTLIALQENALPQEGDLDAAFANAIRLASQGKFDLALDGLLDILRQDKRYREGKARAIVLSVLEILGANDTGARKYRSELMSVLY
ncbi:MAG: thioredoxin [Anaerolineaceae bacterium]|nr:thioredoxin [Anaerolineaceae bacterium]